MLEATQTPDSSLASGDELARPRAPGIRDRPFHVGPNGPRQPLLIFGLTSQPQHQFLDAGLFVHDAPEAFGVAPELVVPSGGKEKRCAQTPFGEQAHRQLRAMAVWQIQIDHGQVEEPLACECSRHSPDSLHAVPRPMDGNGNHFRERGIVFDDENASQPRLNLGLADG